MKYFLDSSVTIRRLKTKSGDLTAYSATATAYEASIQQLGVEKTQLYEGIIGKTYNCFVEESCAAVTADQVIHNGMIFSVKAVKVVDFGSQPYKQLIIVEET